MKTVNLKSDMPSVPQALLRLDRELNLARQQGLGLLKIVHGYGSSGLGGDIRIAVQGRLAELARTGQIRAAIYGEDWSTSDERTWAILKAKPDLKKDPDLGRKNQGITILVL